MLNLMISVASHLFYWYDYVIWNYVKFDGSSSKSHEGASDSERFGTMLKSRVPVGNQRKLGFGTVLNLMISVASFICIIVTFVLELCKFNNFS